jgi:excisionase family DNA binding protein
MKMDTKTGVVNSRKAAELLGVSERTVWKLKGEGKLPYVSIGGRTLFRPETLEHYISEHEVK